MLASYYELQHENDVAESPEAADVLAERAFNLGVVHNILTEHERAIEFYNHFRTLQLNRKEVVANRQAEMECVFNIAGTHDAILRTDAIIF